MDDLEKAAETRLDNRTDMTLNEALCRQAGVPTGPVYSGHTTPRDTAPLAWDLIRFTIAARHALNIEVGDQSVFDRIADYALTYTGE